MEAISVTKLRAMLKQDFNGILIDVREPHEHATANIPQARLIPLGTLDGHLESLPRDQDIHVHCKSGMRSAKAVQLMLDHGFTRVKNVTGGIDAWLKEGK